MAVKRIPIAIVYDFDGTLAPGNVQEHQFLPEVGIKPKDFWAEVKFLSEQHQADPILLYMYRMLKKAGDAEMSIHKKDFEKHGRSINLFDGVNEWFDRITQYGKNQDARVKHYLVSSGNTEIILGTSIAAKFEKIYASKFLFDQNDVAVWPAQAVNFTTMTQYLFRINKGAHDLSDESAINRFVSKKDRPVPFENIVYIGDGSTDVPCFRLIMDQGGLPIAVYKPKTKNALKNAKKYLEDGRVRTVVPAIYTENSELDGIVKAAIRQIVARDALAKSLSSPLPKN